MKNWVGVQTKKRKKLQEWGSGRPTVGQISRESTNRKRGEGGGKQILKWARKMLNLGKVNGGKKMRFQKWGKPVTVRCLLEVLEGRVRQSSLWKVVSEGSYCSPDIADYLECVFQETPIMGDSHETPYFSSRGLINPWSGSCHKCTPFSSSYNIKHQRSNRRGYQAHFDPQDKSQLTTCTIRRPDIM